MVLHQLHVGHHQWRQHKSEDPAPGTDQRSPSFFRRSPGPRQGAASDRHVALYRQVRDEEGGAVVVELVEEVGEPTQELAPHPHVVQHDLQEEDGHDRHHHQVRDADVERAESGGSVRVAALPVDPHDGAVCHQASQEGQEVEEEDDDASGLVVHLHGAVEKYVPKQIGGIAVGHRLVLKDK